MGHQGEGHDHVERVFASVHRDAHHAIAGTHDIRVQPEALAAEGDGAGEVPLPVFEGWGVRHGLQGDDLAALGLKGADGIEGVRLAAPGDPVLGAERGGLGAAVIGRGGVAAEDGLGHAEAVADAEERAHVDGGTEVVCDDGEGEARGRLGEGGAVGGEDFDVRHFDALEETLAGREKRKEVLARHAGAAESGQVGQMRHVGAMFAEEAGEVFDGGLTKTRLVPALVECGQALVGVAPGLFDCLLGGRVHLNARGDRFRHPGQWLSSRSRNARSRGDRGA